MVCRAHRCAAHYFALATALFVITLTSCARYSAVLCRSSIIPSAPGGGDALHRVFREVARQHAFGHGPGEYPAALSEESDPADPSWPPF